MRYKRKVRIMSSRYGAYKQGYTFATMIFTIRGNYVNRSETIKINLSSDCFL